MLAVGRHLIIKMKERMLLLNCNKMQVVSSSTILPPHFTCDQFQKLNKSGTSEKIPVGMRVFEMGYLRPTLVIMYPIGSQSNILTIYNIFNNSLQIVCESLEMKIFTIYNIGLIDKYNLCVYGKGSTNNNNIVLEFLNITYM